jgi:murein DD-endopeptidase MepM/ murein hydrolase activator NlpD
MRLRFLLLIIFICLSNCLRAQPPAYPKYYFRDPLGIPMKLAANFGELRPNHWHMGLDIRTDQKENLPVYAAADGYIAHIGIRPQSFGRFIIINHPNGLSTLYAHLNDFFPALEQYVTAQQYEKQTWEIELDMPKEKFPVTKSQFIAYSGTTGGSEGPHLHFEIRDTKSGKCLNPLLFGLPVQDNVPPNLVRLAVYDRNYSVFEQTPTIIALKNTDSGYIIPNISVIKTGSGRISFGIQAYDRATGSNNPNGIYAASLFFDEQQVIGFVLDSIDYDETLYVNAQADYTYRYNGGVFLQHLSQLPGEHSGVYHVVSGDGVINLKDSAVHKVRVEVKDANFNKSQLNFSVQYSDSLARLVKDSGSYRKTEQHFAPNEVNVLEKPDFELYLPEACLYDTIRSLYFRNNAAAPYAVSASHQVNDASIPVHGGLTVRIKPDKKIPDEWKDKLVIQRSYRNNNSVRKAEWQGGTSTDPEWLSAKFSDFGTFRAFADIMPPEINDLGSADTIDVSPAKKIIFRPVDNFGVIKNFRAELDSQWLRFTNDKGILWVYNFDQRCPYGVHQLKVTVEDLVGNTTTKSWWFKRYPYTPPKKKVISKKKKSPKKKPATVKKKTAAKNK